MKREPGFNAATEAIVAAINATALNKTAALRIAEIALANATSHGHALTAEKLGILIDFAELDAGQARALAVRLVRKAKRAQGAA